MAPPAPPPPPPPRSAPKVTEEQQKADEEAKRRREEEGKNPLLKKIEQGTKLRVVPKGEKSKGEKGSGSGGLFETLKNAMFARRKAVASDDDKSDDEHDSEWDDI